MLDIILNYLESNILHYFNVILLIIFFLFLGSYWTQIKYHEDDGLRSGTDNAQMDFDSVIQSRKQRCSAQARSYHYTCRG